MQTCCTGTRPRPWPRRSCPWRPHSTRKGVVDGRCGCVQDSFPAPQREPRRHELWFKAHCRPQPERIDPMPATRAEVVVVIAATQVVEPNRDPLFVLGERNLERLAWLPAFLHLALRFEEHRESILRLRCERQLLGFG